MEEEHDDRHGGHGELNSGGSSNKRRRQCRSPGWEEVARSALEARVTASWVATELGHMWVDGTASGALLASTSWW